MMRKLTALNMTGNLTKLTRHQLTSYATITSINTVRMSNQNQPKTRIVKSEPTKDESCRDGFFTSKKNRRILHR